MCCVGIVEGVNALRQQCALLCTADNVHDGLMVVAVCWQVHAVRAFMARVGDGGGVQPMLMSGTCVAGGLGWK